MPLDYRTVNSLWASVLVETLARLGIRYAVTCPGSRSTPLTMAFAAHPDMDAIPVLDERSGSFFALGLAKRTHTLIPVICTSGTAAANFFPAVIEAHESGIPLLLLTADRPPELRHCHSGQTIDQLKIYGNYPVWQAELSLPKADIKHLAYLRQITQYAHDCALTPGPVHLNIPFEDPLAPTKGQSLVFEDLNSETETTFFALVKPSPSTQKKLDPQWFQDQGSQWQHCPRGLIVVGEAQPLDPDQFAQAIGYLSQYLGWPVLADSLSPLRQFHAANPNLISTYDLLLRDPDLALQLQPEQVIQVGPLPTSKTLRACLQQWDPFVWLIDERAKNLDPLHGRTQRIRVSIQDLAGAFKPLTPNSATFHSNYRERWLKLEQFATDKIHQTMGSETHIFESRIPWLLAQNLPQNVALVVANSNPVRDMESFWIPNDQETKIYCNRGANGIDGTLSTALGIAHNGIPTFLLTGDLALLHDTNGFLTLPKFQGSLTVLVINNQGGGIFEMLPIAEYDPPFEEYFATPQDVDFRELCQTYHVSYQWIQDWDSLLRLIQSDPKRGVRLIEIKTDRKADSQWRKTTIEGLAKQVKANFCCPQNELDLSP